MAISINFEQIGDAIESYIVAKDKAMYDNTTTQDGATVPDPLTSQLHRYKMFYNSGDYLSYQQKEAAGDANDEILINIINDGGVQDATVPINTYLQMVHIAFYAPEKFRTDLETILFSLTIDLKAKLDTIAGTAVQITTDDQPTFNEKQSLGIDVFDGYFDLSVIVYAGAHLSNNFVLKLDGISIPFSTIDLGRGYEATPDLQKRNAVKYIQNTSSFSIKVTALYVSNDEVSKLMSDASSNSNFNTQYNVALYEGSSTSAIMSMSMFAKNIQFHFAYGSIVSWEADFVEALSV